MRLLGSTRNGIEPVVGYASTVDAPSGIFAFVFEPFDGSMRRLSDDPAVVIASAINDLGQVTGQWASIKGSRAFITGPDAVGLRLLGTLAGKDSTGSDINATGQILGGSSADTPGRHAFITGPDGDGMTDLGLGGGQSNFSAAFNDAGETTGFIGFKSGASKQYITGPNGVDLKRTGALGPRDVSQGVGINNHGVTVGKSSKGSRADYSVSVVVAHRDGRIYDLNKWIVNLPAGVTMNKAGGINDFNQISAGGSDGKCYIVCPQENCTR